ncbi:MAG: sugar-transfer associated ATP-grasp domain-containing protein, partial [Pseudomonadota bacterium]
FGTKGYLFQDVLAPHPAVAAITGGGLATLRVVILLDGQMPMIENLKMHIPGPNSLADTIWRGNSAGLLDPQTGQIKRVVRGSGLDLVELESHPATGADLLSFQLPDFDKLTDLMARISAEFPLLRLQGWDIAVTDRGYVPIELNFGGDVKLQQLCDGAGAMTPRYTELLKSAGYKGKLP